MAIKRQTPTYDNGDLAVPFLPREFAARIDEEVSGLWKYILPEDQIFYIRADGDDAHDGKVNSAGRALRTMQGLMSKILAINLAGFNVVAICGAGTYPKFKVSAAFIGNATITIIGDETTPSNCLISAHEDHAVLVQNAGATITMKGFKVITTGTGTYYPFYAYKGGRINIGKIEFGRTASTGSLFGADWNGSVIEQIDEITVGDTTGGNPYFVIHNNYGGEYRNSDSHPIKFKPGAVFQSGFFGVRGGRLVFNNVPFDDKENFVGPSFVAHQGAYINLNNYAALEALPYDLTAILNLLPGSGINTFISGAIINTIMAGNIIIAPGKHIPYLGQLFTDAQDGVSWSAANGTARDLAVVSRLGEKIITVLAGTKNLLLCEGGGTASAATQTFGLNTTALSTCAFVQSAVAAAQAASQPLDSDLTAIAALSTTSFGRDLLTMADAAATRTKLGISGDTGTGSMVRQTSAALVTPDIGAATGASLAIGSTTDATSTTSAPLKSAGGLAVAKRGRFGGAIYPGPDSFEAGVPKLYVGDGLYITMGTGTSLDGAIFDRAGTALLENFAASNNLRLCGGGGRVTLGGLLRFNSWTVAGLPAGAAGDTAYCSNARVHNAAAIEGPGAGTGGIVNRNSTGWVVAGTFIAAQA